MPKYKKVPKKKRRNKNFEKAAYQTEIRGPLLYTIPGKQTGFTSLGCPIYYSYQGF